MNMYNNENIYDVKLLMGSFAFRHCLIFSHQPVNVGDEHLIYDLILEPLLYKISTIVETTKLSDETYRTECYSSPKM